MNDETHYKRYRFPWRDGNQFDLLVDGKQFFPQIIADISRASRYILLEMYLFESGQVAREVISALDRAAQRGVRIYILLDDYGAQGLEIHDRQKLQHDNVQMVFYNPLHYGEFRRNLFRDHRKIIIIDQTVAYTGGAGVTDEFDHHTNPVYYWHEVMIRVHGPCVADWTSLFLENWNKWSETRAEFATEPETPAPGDTTGRVVESHSITHSEVIGSFVTRIRHAERRVWLATAYFVPSRKLQKALQKSAENGVDVRLLLPGPHTDHPWARHIGRRYYTALLKKGVRIFEYQPRFIHMKILLCDQWTSIGSSNIDRWNFRWNLEANQEVEDDGFARRVQTLFETDFLESREIRLQEWSHRPWYVEIRLWFWGLILSFLSWFSYQKKLKKNKRRRILKKWKS